MAEDDRRPPTLPHTLFPPGRSGPLERGCEDKGGPCRHRRMFQCVESICRGTDRGPARVNLDLAAARAHLCAPGRETASGSTGGSVAEGAADPPGPIPNPVVTRRSAGEYCGGDPTGGEAAAGSPVRRSPAPRSATFAFDCFFLPTPPRGGAAAARWAHNPKVGGSNPSPATK